ncbi:YaeQ family protein [Neiella marina]|uniref:YaeQ family protein n=1 Tax=Neiella holothuriorum TaxID=2870530 RepID=A0ABS7EHG6_9GAMM|nr:YaeQ family protein [Neiella holothuriorum]MBW8191122.1 YaeQ family protein [Neiella holothuriorum]
MALKSTIYKAAISIADMERHYYQDHQLTIAKHPSENDKRMMLRLLAFAACADDGLEFCKGLSSDDEPALWQLDATGVINHWIELGIPEPKRLKKACAKANQVSLFAYGNNALTMWWQQHQQLVEALPNLTILQVQDDDLTELADFAERNMALSLSHQDGVWMLASEQRSISLELTKLMPS